MSVTTQEEKNGKNDAGHRRGKIFVIGVGPGKLDQMTLAAQAAMAKATVVIGYKYYIELVGELLADKKIISSGMCKEIMRCESALEEAAKGETVALISSGDAGIYGMAGPLMELPGAAQAEIEVIPGVSAAQAAAALCGAPLMNDFAVISLSDLLTPWEVIEKRLEGAASGDFVIALYNPKSKKRVEQIKKAQSIIAGHRFGETPVLVARNVYREGEEMVFSDLNSFTEIEMGMLSIVIVGNSQTKLENGRMVTARGYTIPARAAV